MIEQNRSGWFVDFSVEFPYCSLCIDVTSMCFSFVFFHSLVSEILLSAASSSASSSFQILYSEICRFLRTLTKWKSFSIPEQSMQTTENSLHELSDISEWILHKRVDFEKWQVPVDSVRRYITHIFWNSLEKKCFQKPTVSDSTWHSRNACRAIVLSGGLRLRLVLPLDLTPTCMSLLNLNAFDRNWLQTFPLSKQKRLAKTGILPSMLFLSFRLWYKESFRFFSRYQKFETIKHHSRL